MFKNKKLNYGFLLLALVIFTLSSASWSATVLPEVNNIIPNIVDKVSPAVVNVNTSKIMTITSPFAPFAPFFDQLPEQFQREVPQRGIGTGFIFRKDGYILTNNHVIEGADEIRVTLLDGREFTGKVIGADSLTDIAVVKVEAENLPTLSLGDSDAARVGEFVVAIGNPYGLSHTVTMGVLSAKGRAVPSGDTGQEYENFLQTDAAINPGNSGGPLLNLDGEVIGINTAIIPFAQGVGFAIPINMAKSILDQLIEKGKVVRAWLGVYIQNVTPEIAKQFGYEGTKGALVADVIENGPAAKANFQRGDIIFSVNNQEITDTKHLQNTIRSLKPGDTAEIQVWRNGEKKTIKVQLEELQEGSASISPVEIISQKIELGMEISEITADLQQKYGFTESKGVVVVLVKPGGPAEEAGLRAGDVILQINRNDVSSVEDFNSVLAKVEPGDTVILLISRSGRTLFVPVKAIEKK
ncbi:MAG: DegQ family serine endoprotease [Candidatus Atribacteria bacterium]|nr:DegQ family serine endoprotease [Candidatus Atribacteria bacterium]